MARQTFDGKGGDDRSYSLTRVYAVAVNVEPVCGDRVEQ